MNKNISFTILKEITDDEKKKIEKMFGDYGNVFGDVAKPIPDVEICAELLNLANCSVQKTKLHKKIDFLRKRIVEVDKFYQNCERTCQEKAKVNWHYSLYTYFFDLGRSLEVKNHLCRRLQTMIRATKILDQYDEDEQVIYKLMYELANKKKFTKIKDEKWDPLVYLYRELIPSIHNLAVAQWRLNNRLKDRHSESSEIEKLMTEDEAIKDYVDAQLALEDAAYLLGRCDGCVDHCYRNLYYLSKDSFEMDVDDCDSDICDSHNCDCCTNSWLKRLKRLFRGGKIEISEKGVLLFK